MDGNGSQLVPVLAYRQGRPFSSIEGYSCTSPQR